MKSTTSTCIWACAAVCIAASTLTLQASTTGFIVPEFRGAANTEHGYWENFSQAFASPNAPDQLGTNPDGRMTQLMPGGVLTGTFNIYNPAGASLFEITDSTPYALGSVVLQVRTQGTELDYSSVTLTYDIGGGPQTVPAPARGELNRVVVPGFGSNVSSIWQWDLTGLGATSYRLNFAASGPHLSLDSVQLDTVDTFTAVPEPTTMALAGLGWTALVLRRKR